MPAFSYACLSFLLLWAFAWPVAAQNKADCVWFQPLNGLQCYDSIVTAPGCAANVQVIVMNVPTGNQDLIQLTYKPPGAEVTVSNVPLEQSVKAAPGSFADATARTQVLTTFEWIPSLSSAGTNNTIGIAFNGASTANCPEFQRLCSFSFVVQKCRFCAGARDSLDTIAAQYGRHWTQLWSSNPSLLSPDTLAAQTLTESGSGIMILGNTYSPRAGDTWAMLSVRFGIPVDLLHRLNPDKTTSSNGNIKPVEHREGYLPVPAGSNALVQIDPASLLCIMPETCPQYRPSMPGISW